MSIWIPDLADREGPKYLQVADAMREDIAAGRLRPDARLPPYRELAYQLSLSPNTISRAYAEGITRGFLRGEVGRGTYVRDPEAELKQGAVDGLNRPSEGPVDLSRNLPLPGFAKEAIRAGLDEIGRDPALHSLLDYQTDKDIARHAQSGLIWLDHCGVAAEPDEVVATLGGQHGIFCTMVALLRPGDLLLTESLTYMPVCAIADRLQLHVRTVAMDALGPLPEAFEEICAVARPKMFYLSPTLQAPTAVTLPLDRRKAIAEIAQKHNVLLVEDDVFAPLKPDRPQALAVLAPDQTIYITSLSKAVAPGLRVGFVRMPSRFVPAFRHAVSLSVWMPPPLVLEVAWKLIRDGQAARIAGVQREAASRRQAMARRLLDGIPHMGDPTGLHVWLPLPAGYRADLVRAQAARAGVLVSEGRSFAPDPRDAPEALRLCLSHESSEERVERGLRLVADLLRSPSSASTPDI